VTLAWCTQHTNLDKAILCTLCLCTLCLCTLCLYTLCPPASFLPSHPPQILSLARALARALSLAYSLSLSLTRYLSFSLSLSPSFLSLNHSTLDSLQKDRETLTGSLAHTLAHTHTLHTLNENTLGTITRCCWKWRTKTTSGPNAFISGPCRCLPLEYQGILG